jgi:hypothetical protein
MKQIVCTLLVLISTSFFLNAQQVSLYDREGDARAYIDYDQEATIFMWDGTPVAFLNKEGNNIGVVGFSGSFLGWYEEGVVYDKKGYKVGTRKEGAFITKMERIKGIQKIVPIKPITPITPISPIFLISWSPTSLTEFLYWGKK